MSDDLIPRAGAESFGDRYAKNLTFPLFRFFLPLVHLLFKCTPPGGYKTPDELEEARALSTGFEVFFHVLIFHAQRCGREPPLFEEGKESGSRIGGARYHAAIPHIQPPELFIRVEAKARLAASLVLPRARRPART